MATLHLRYTSGEDHEWELRDQLPALELAKHLKVAQIRGRVIGFPVKARHSDMASDYGFVGVRMTEVASWYIDGLVDDSESIGSWMEEPQNDKEG